MKIKLLFLVSICMLFITLCSGDSIVEKFENAIIKGDIDKATELALSINEDYLDELSLDELDSLASLANKYYEAKKTTEAGLFALACKLYYNKISSNIKQ